MSFPVLKLQDEERRHIGRDLHDTVGQYLAATKMSLEGLALQDPFDEDEIRKQIAISLPMIDRVIREVRTLSYLFRPAWVDTTDRIECELLLKLCR